MNQELTVNKPSNWQQGDPIPEKVIKKDKYTVFVMPAKNQNPTPNDLDGLHCTLAQLLRKQD